MAVVTHNSRVRVGPAVAGALYYEAAHQWELPPTDSPAERLAQYYAVLGLWGRPKGGTDRRTYKPITAPL